MGAQDVQRHRIAVNPIVYQIDFSLIALNAEVIIFERAPIFPNK